jgi:hypothetical protein
MRKLFVVLFLAVVGVLAFTLLFSDNTSEDLKLIRVNHKVWGTDCRKVNIVMSLFFVSLAIELKETSVVM